MVTGSHIPFDRNGYKTNSSRGELLKEQEAPINEQVTVRKRLYEQPWEQSLFDERGMLKSGHQALPEEQGEARAAYIERFTGLLRRLIAQRQTDPGLPAFSGRARFAGGDPGASGGGGGEWRPQRYLRSDRYGEYRRRATCRNPESGRRSCAGSGALDAVVSTDGDSDRPLVLGVDAATGRVHFFGGDLLGMVVAEYLEADAVVVPISCNDAIDRGKLAPVVEPKTRIGSPFVIAGMEAALAKGKKRVCGWEPNGGFLTGSADLPTTEPYCQPLLTRDAGLPILGVLFASEQNGLSLIDLFARLPKRFQPCGSAETISASQPH